ncbi:hypothetical protein BJ508DRAFT_332858 [Ascobolus immersus RN42]|uniref:Geranylgeranyl pyrophosphate synthetase n=1 Tax=Ascobolus immersus RN42 TaxID=1160509 RepID=A0A3N4HY79_ASCIM|nr:hypothetical protein BJ508DRAFT_332858 [Ascobolus immersus RN42]
MKDPLPILWSSLVDDPSVSVTKKNFRDLTSYNWLKGKTSTIAVPGHPPIWKPKPAGEATQLKKDKGRTFVNENAARCPVYPMEPLFRSLAISAPDFDFGPISLIIDRASLRRLLEFATGQAPKKKFTLNVQRFGGLTMIFNHSEKPKAKGGFGGYGDGFENAFTRWPKGLEHSTRHHRVVEYEFGGMQMLVRFEADAAIMQEDAKEGLPIGWATSDGQIHPTPDGSSIAVCRSGSAISYTSIAEMKTRHSGKGRNMGAIYPQIWFSNTQHIIIGTHKDGLFSDVVPTDVRVDCPERQYEGNDGSLGDWELKNRVQLSKLGDMLRKICNVAEGHQEAFTVRYVDRTMLEVKRQPNKVWLPRDVVQWIGGSSTTANC